MVKSSKEYYCDKCKKNVLCFFIGVQTIDNEPKWEIRCSICSNLIKYIDYKK
jgi:DNA-directed RNA polymerase subunit RPC12/RpoP